MPDVDVDGARIAVRGVAPDVLEQHLAREDPPRRAGERGEDLELDVREPDGLPRERHGAALEIDLELPGADRLAGRSLGRHAAAAPGGPPPAAGTRHPATHCGVVA